MSSLSQSGNASNDAPIPGNWPTPTPRWAIVLSAMLWGVWVLFLVWMMVLRINVQPSAGG